MHGYFMDLKAYQKLLSAVNPFAFEKFKKDQIKNRLAQTARINLKKVTPKANIDYMKELENREQDKTKKKDRALAKDVLADDRFK